MFKFLSIAVLGIASLLVTISAAQAGGRRCCSCPGPAAAPATPPAPTTGAQPPSGTQVYRSYSHEPQGAQRSYSRSYRSPSRGEFDAGRKMRGL